VVDARANVPVATPPVPVPSCFAQTYNPPRPVDVTVVWSPASLVNPAGSVVVYAVFVAAARVEAMIRMRLLSTVGVTDGAVPVVATT
jgi:hypothetical protein